MKNPRRRRLEIVSPGQDIGLPTTLHLPDLPRSSGPFLLRDFRQQAPTTINSIMAMYAAIYRRDRRPDRRPISAAARGIISWPERVVRALRQQGFAARKVFGRSLLGQALDMTRAWYACDLRPDGYYEGQLARHAGGPEVTGYLGWPVLSRVLVELQRDTFGSPSFMVNDKAAFGTWCRVNGLRNPREMALDDHAPPPSVEAIAALGDRVIVKPRSSMGGRDVEAWHRGADGWSCGDRRSLSASELAHHIAHRAATFPGGVVVQERLRNHEALTALCGEALSTCRVVTVLNEHGEPEVVELLWRFATRPDAVVDNFNAGGTFWIACDMETGEIGHGIDPGSTEHQAVLSVHPLTGKPMAGEHHPFWPEIRAFALAGHRKLNDLILVGWDIAMTPDGPTAIEINFPPALSPRTQIVWGGLDHSRLGEILAWRARRWLARNA